ncbi:putative pectinesterase 52 [Raphanus sativus]|nr:putative pectinesterase 52 [Raphanus sativus]
MANSSRVSPHGLEHKQPKDFNIDIIKTVVVGQSGETDFKTVQAAIDSIPSGQADSSGPIVVNAEYFVAINVTFKNSYNSRTSLVPHKEIKVAPSIVLMADKAWFYGCSFISVQDTLADFVGRHYFKNCYIEGAIDFIWGGGQSIYEKCVIYVKGVTKDESVKSGALMAGFITAQGRQSEQDTSGFVFKYCTIKGDGKAYLGRAYRDYSRVVFYATSMSNVIVPQGWDAWHYKGKEDKITFAEVNCTGEGANKQGRVEWDKNLSDRDIAPLYEGECESKRIV